MIRLLVFVGVAAAALALAAILAVGGAYYAVARRTSPQ